MSVPFQSYFKPCATVQVGTFLVSNLDGEGLEIGWSCKLNPTRSGDETVISIYNLGETYDLIRAAHDLANGLLPMTLSIGWEMLPKVLSIGEITKISKKPTGDGSTVAVFQTGAIESAIQDAYVSSVVNQGTLDLIISFLVIAKPPSGLGLIISPETLAFVQAKVAALQIPPYANWVGLGKTSDRITDLLNSIGCEWRGFRGEFIVTEGGMIPGPPIVFTELSGLLDFEESDDGGCVVLAYGDPGCIPGKQFTVIKGGIPVGAPAYRVHQVEFSGSTAGGSDMKVIAKKPVI